MNGGIFSGFGTVVLTPYLLVIAGFVLLTGGAEALVRGSVALAERLGISPLLIGLTVVAFGTSAPELVVSLTAALNGAPAISVGNVVGSNIANICLILGVTGLIWPVPCENPKTFFKDSGLLLLTSILFAVILLTGTVERWHGGVMTGLLFAYLIYSYRREQMDKEPLHAQEVEEFEQFKEKPWIVVIGITLVGLAAVLWGADLLVEGAVDIARSLGISEEVIGLTMVAFGTSLPELATSLVAAWRRHTELALGNIIGSCLFNILGIMGVTALLIPIPVAPQFIVFDVWVMVGAAFILMPFIMTSGRLSRKEAALLCVFYLAYVAAQFYGVAKILPWSVA